jgi:hypothetical protein
LSAIDRDFEVLVNTRRSPVEGPQISFEAVVTIAYPTPPGPSPEYTVTYRHGPEQNPQGQLYQAQSAFVKNGMAFSVNATDKS